MKKLQGLLLGGALLCSLAGCGRTTGTVQAAPEASPSANTLATLQGMELAGIKTEKAVYRTMERQLTLNGQVSTTETGKVDVTVALNGIVVAPLVKVGQSVEKGQVLAEVNSVYGQTALQILQKLEQDQTALSQAQSSLTQAVNGVIGARTTLVSARQSLATARDTLNQANAEMVNATTDLHRKELLFKEGVFAKSDVEDATERWLKARSAQQVARNNMGLSERNVRLTEKSIPSAEQNVSALREAVNLAQTTLERDKIIFSQSSVSGSALSNELTSMGLQGKGFSKSGAVAATRFEVRAPIDGTVTSVAMASGQAVAPGAVVATIVNNAQVYVDGSAFEADLPFVHKGEPVSVKVTAFPGTTFSGTVFYVGKVEDPTTHTIPVRSLISNPGQILRPAMFASVTLGGGGEKRLAVPDSAVLIHGDHRYLFVQSGEGKFDKHEVQTGVSGGGYTEIKRGVAAGDTVVVQGNLILEGQE
jgi:RND family efflux transporter MFP subunit